MVSTSQFYSAIHFFFFVSHASLLKIGNISKQNEMP
jgi:hypothetical protein